jgi:hypothetical protein
MSEKWDLHKLIYLCVQEEDRLKAQNGGFLNYVQNNTKKRTFGSKGYKPKNQHESGGFSSNPSKPHGKAPVQSDQPHPSQGKKSVPKDSCMWCKEQGHWQKDCVKWMKYMNTHGEDIITFLDESLFLSYSKSTWSIDSGATIHVANSLQ